MQVKQKLFRAFVVGTTKRLSSNNNFSTKVLRKENFISIPKQLHNNNKLKMNIVVHDFKYYSSSSVNSNNNTIQVLNPVQYKRWDKEDVCSLLCTDEENGGSGLTIEDVKPLYEVGFDGSSLANIVTCIQKKDMYFAIKQVKQDFQNISQTTLKAVVFWVDNLLKTRLYHLWSADQVREQLCKPFDEGGANLKESEIPSNYTLSKQGNEFDTEVYRRITSWSASLHITVPYIVFITNSTMITEENVKFLNLEEFKKCFENDSGSENTNLPSESILLSSFGATFKFVERDEIISNIFTTFRNRPHHRNLDKQNVVFPFIAAAPGVGKSRLLKEIGLKAHSISVEGTTSSPVIPLFVSFSNGTGLANYEDRNNSLQCLIARMIYAAFARLYGFSIKSFVNFLLVWYKFADKKQFTIEEALIIISSILGERNADYFLALDEAHVLDLKTSSQTENPLQKIISDIGSYISSNKSYNKLYVVLAGTSYTSIFENLQESTFNPQFFPLKSLLSTTSIDILLDDLSTKYEKLKGWRTDSNFRNYLRRFSGYPRGVEYFLSYYLIYTEGNLESAWSNTSSFLKARYGGHSLITYHSLAKCVFSKMKMTRDMIIPNSNPQVTFGSSENIGGIMINGNSQNAIAVYPTFLLEKYIPYDFFRYFKLLYYENPYELTWEDIVHNYHFLVLYLLADESQIQLSDLFRFAKMNSSTGKITIKDSKQKKRLKI